MFSALSASAASAPTVAARRRRLFDLGQRGDSSPPPCCSRWSRRGVRAVAAAALHGMRQLTSGARQASAVNPPGGHGSRHAITSFMNALPAAWRWQQRAEQGSDLRSSLLCTALFDSARDGSRHVLNEAVSVGGGWRAAGDLLRFCVRDSRCGTLWDVVDNKSVSTQPGMCLWASFTSITCVQMETGLRDTPKMPTRLV